MGLYSRPMSKQASSVIALNVMFVRDSKDRAAFEKEGLIPDAADHDMAVKALEWARAKYSAIPEDRRNDFEQNMYVVAHTNTIPTRSLGLLAYIVGEYARFLDLKHAEKELSVSKHVGTVGGKIHITGTVYGASVSYGDFGPSTRLNIRDADGNAIIWWYSGVKDVAVGAEVFVQAKVKAHGEFNNVAQTTISHGKFFETAEELALVAKKEQLKADKAAAKLAKLAA